MTAKTELPPVPVGRDELLRYLDQCGFETVVHDHEPVFTVEESQDLHRELDGGHTKNLFLKDKKSRYFLITAGQDTEIDLKGVHRLLGGTGRVSFGKADALEEMLGVKPGSVTAFGVINDRDNAVTFAIDKRLLDHDLINCHPLTNDATVSIRREDLLTFARDCGHDPMIIDFEAEAPD